MPSNQRHGHDTIAAPITLIVVSIFVQSSSIWQFCEARNKLIYYSFINQKKQDENTKISFHSIFLYIIDCLHLQLYRDSKDRYKQGQTKASLSLQHFLGVETGFTLDKESNTIAIICQDVIVVLAFDTRERLIQWQVIHHTHSHTDAISIYLSCHSSQLLL